MIIHLLLLCIENLQTIKFYLEGSLHETHRGPEKSEHFHVNAGSAIGSGNVLAWQGKKNGSKLSHVLFLILAKDFSLLYFCEKVTYK